jgi:hypothetical protein
MPVRDFSGCYELRAISDHAIVEVGVVATGNRVGAWEFQTLVRAKGYTG